MDYTVQFTGQFKKDAKGCKKRNYKIILLETAMRSLREKNIRETFFVNQVSFKHLTENTDHGDFLVGRTYTFEIGGSTKTGKQIAHLENSYIAADIEYGSTNKIPLWLFGFLY